MREGERDRDKGKVGEIGDYCINGFLAGSSALVFELITAYCIIHCAADNLHVEQTESREQTQCAHH